MPKDYYTREAHKRIAYRVHVQQAHGPISWYEKTSHAIPSAERTVKGEGAPKLPLWLDRLLDENARHKFGSLKCEAWGKLGEDEFIQELIDGIKFQTSRDAFLRASILKKIGGGCVPALLDEYLANQREAWLSILMQIGKPSLQGAITRIETIQRHTDQGACHSQNQRYCCNRWVEISPSNCQDQQSTLLKLIERFDCCDQEIIQRLQSICANKNISARICNQTRDLWQKMKKQKAALAGKKT